MAWKQFRALAAALVALIAVPVVAQTGFSDSYTFLKAVRERDAAKVEGIIINPSSNAVNARSSDTGEGALHMLVRDRDSTWLSYLLSHGARPDIQDRDGNTPLMIASQIGWVDGGERLLDRGANINAVNNRGETALIFAVQLRNLPMVRMLMSRGANPDQTDSVAGYSALDYARQDRRAQAILRILENPPPRAAR